MTSCYNNILNKNTDTSFQFFFLYYWNTIFHSSTCLSLFLYTEASYKLKSEIQLSQKKANKYLYFIFPAEPVYAQIPEDQPSHPLSQPRSPPPYSDALEHLPYNPSYEPQPWAEDCWPGESKLLGLFRLMFCKYTGSLSFQFIFCTQGGYFLREQSNKHVKASAKLKTHINY